MKNSKNNFIINRALNSCLECKSLCNFAKKDSTQFKFHFFLPTFICFTFILETTRPATTTTTTPVTMRRQKTDIDNEIEDERRQDVKTRPGAGSGVFSKAMCASLRVPCRFVTEHPCCKMPQDIGMLGR